MKRKSDSKIFPYIFATLAILTTGILLVQSGFSLGQRNTAWLNVAEIVMAVSFVMLLIVQIALSSRRKEIQYYKRFDLCILGIFLLSLLFYAWYADGDF
ncbi:MAG: hypothetical protein ACK5LK_08700, partial [Chthoniobacterales bacterium]